MIPARVNEATPVPPPAYHCAQARLGPALHIDALTALWLVRTPGRVVLGLAATLT